MNALEIWRQDLRLTQAELAELLDSDQRTVRRYLLPLDNPDYREPNAHARRAIEIITRGKVTASDLIPLDKRADRRRQRRIRMQGAEA